LRQVLDVAGEQERSGVKDQDPQPEWCGFAVEPAPTTTASNGKPPSASWAWISAQSLHT